jgi:hypothetical protein
MKTQIKRVALAIALLGTFNTQLSTALAQGSLTPPAAPAPTMKSLDQIEARTPISSAPFNISQPGSHFLTTNVTVSSGNAITIATNGVTLDLNGFTISSTEASPTGAGILLNNGLKNITILNGHIRGSVTNDGSGVYSGKGFGCGIIGNFPVNVVVSRVSVSGCLYCGIYLGIGDSTVVESCTVRTVGNDGIVASTIKTSSAVDCGGNAIYGDQVSDCRGQSTGSGNGVVANAIAQNCYGYSSDGDGVVVHSSAQNCYGVSSSGDGIYASYTVQNCYGSSLIGNGVVANIALDCYGRSYISYGVDANTAQNCYGRSYSSYGVYAYRIAIGCFGYSDYGTGLYAFIANVCSGDTLFGTALSTPHNVNSF